MYTVELTGRAQRELKKFDRALKEKTANEVRDLSENPLLGMPLSKPFAPVRSYHFSFKGVQYRIAYHIEEEQRRIIIHLVAARENFYDKLRRAL